MNTITAVAAAKRYAAAHKYMVILGGIVLLGGGYYAVHSMTSAPTATRYVTTTVATGTVVAALTETGQASASQELPLTPKVSGEVTGVYVTPGSHVVAGQAIAQLDATDALQTLQEAKLTLANQELSYQQATASSTLSLNLLKAQNGVTTAQTSLDQTRNSAYTSLANIYTDLGTVTTGLDAALYNQDVKSRSNQSNVDAFTNLVSTHDNSIDIYKNSAETSYTSALNTYNAALATYKASSATLSNSALISLAQTTYQAAQAAAIATKNVHDFFDRVSTDYSLYNMGTSATLTSLLSSVNGYANTVSTDQSNALSAQSNITNAEQALAEAQNTLSLTQGGANALTVQQASLALQQAQNAVTNAQQSLSYYTIRAPFSGIVASVNVQKYDQASSGTTIATVVTDQQTVDISVNEVDASKLKVGEKATLTFDALPNISIAGTVSSVNALGTVSSGVVSYDAVITFDTPNAAVKPGMSATASVIVGEQTGLVVPSSAVHTAGNTSYVEVFTQPLAGSQSTTGAPSATPPSSVPVTTGLTDNTNIVITSGLSAGEQIVTRTVAGTSATTPTSAAQSTSLFGSGRAGGFAGRALSR